jgi:hypothetical protein
MHCWKRLEGLPKKRRSQTRATVSAIKARATWGFEDEHQLGPLCLLADGVRGRASYSVGPVVAAMVRKRLLGFSFSFSAKLGGPAHNGWVCLVLKEAVTLIELSR